MSAHLRLVECRAIINGEHDPLRAVWDEKASVKDRRLLLAMAGETGPSVGRLALRAWCDLPGDLRAAVANGLRRFKGWAAKVAP